MALDEATAALGAAEGSARFAILSIFYVFCALAFAVLARRLLTSMHMVGMVGMVGGVVAGGFCGGYGSSWSENSPLSETIGCRMLLGIFGAILASAMKPRKRRKSKGGAQKDEHSYAGAD